MGLSGAYYSDRIKIKKRKIADVKGVYGPRPITAPAPAASGGTTRGREYRRIRRMPFRAHGRVHSRQICGQPQNKGAVTVKKVTNDCVFVLLTIHYRIFRRIIEYVRNHRICRKRARGPHSAGRPLPVGISGL